MSKRNDCVKALARKGRYRRILSVEISPAFKRHSHYLTHTLTLTCGHKIVRLGGPHARWKNGMCPVASCDWPKFVDEGAGI